MASNLFSMRQALIARSGILATGLLFLLPWLDSSTPPARAAVVGQSIPVTRQAPAAPGKIQVDRSATEGASPWSYANYGIWDIRIEAMERDAQGNWQAVVWVRDAASYRVGLTTDGVAITMFDSDGRSVATASTLYRAAVRGTWSQLEAIPQTMWMEKGDEIRVRLFFPRSARFDPVRLRIWSNDRETFSRTFNFD